MCTVHWSACAWVDALGTQKMDKLREVFTSMWSMTEPAAVPIMRRSYCSIVLISQASFRSKKIDNESMKMKGRLSEIEHGGVWAHFGLLEAP